MTINQHAIIPPIDVLYTSRLGIVMEMTRTKSERKLRKLQVYLRSIVTYNTLRLKI